MFKIQTKSSIQIHFVNADLAPELQTLVVSNFYNLYSKNIKTDGNINFTKSFPFVLDSLLISDFDANFSDYNEKIIEKQYLLFSLKNLFLEKLGVEVYFSGHFESVSYFDGSEWMAGGESCRVDQIPAPKRINVINSEFCHENVPMPMVAQVKTWIEENKQKD